MITGGVLAYIKNSDVDSAKNVLVKASNTSTIDAQVLSAAASLGVGAAAGGAVSIGASIAENSIGFDADGSKTPLESPGIR